MPTHLTLVTSLEEIRASVVQFNVQAPQAKDRARSLLRTTTFWVFDPTTAKFGPGKFVGFATMDFASYEAATRGDAGGARFDDHTTRAAVEKALEVTFSPDPNLPDMLRRWGEALVGPGALDGLADGASKWKFVALPAAAPNYWKIAPGEKAVFWDENRKAGIIAVGWGQAGDPLQCESKKDLEALLTKVFGYNRDQAQANATSLWWFLHETQPGDIIVANQGQSKVVGRGIVLGPPTFRAERGEYGNCLPVHWFVVEPRDIPQQKHWFATILRIAAQKYQVLFGGPPVVGGPGNGGGPIAPAPANRSIYDFLRDRGLHFPPELVTTYLLSLKTKPFVILSGISGTGKTKLAQAVAEWAGSEVREEEEDAPLEAPSNEPDVWVCRLGEYTFKHRKLHVRTDYQHLFDLPPEGTVNVLVRYAQQDFQGFLGAMIDNGRKKWELRFTTKLVERLRQDVGPGDFVAITAERDAAPQWLTIERLEKERRVRMEMIHRHEFVSVRPDWLDGKEALGFYNVLTEEYVPRPFLNLLLRAHREKDKPHFAILDEMNLARVEHYFADLLSATESRTIHEGKLRQEALQLHGQPKCLPLAPSEDWERPERCGPCKATQDEIDACPLHFDGVQLVPPRLNVPANVYVTGTVNIDETTHMFSPKVLDRANVIEFNEVDLDGYGDVKSENGFMLKDGGVALGRADVGRQEHFKGAPDKVQKTLTALNKLLTESNLHFGYRVANEIGLYLKNTIDHVGAGEDVVDAALDLQILQKVLPKFHGPKSKLLEPLWMVLLFATFGPGVEARYSDADFEKIEPALRKGDEVPVPGGTTKQKPVMPRSAVKLARMMRTLRSQGFVSFIE